MSYIAVGGAAVSVVGGLFASSAAKSREREAAANAARLNAQLTSLENSRQAIVNPYATTKDVSGLAKDTSGMLSNPYASLGVATQATKIQLQETDSALANTLDTLRETGAGAGGATALAMAALKSKQGVVADLESQEVANDKLRAQGEQQLQQMKMAEQQRIQGVQISEAQRIQSAEAAGKQFMFETQENREQQKMDRIAAQLGGAQKAQTQAQSDQTAAWAGALSAVGNIGAAAAGKTKP